MPSKKTLHKSSIHKNFDFGIKFQTIPKLPFSSLSIPTMSLRALTCPTSFDNL